MTRPLRLPFPGGVYHITARGNDRQAIFEDDADCSRFLIVLASVVARYRVRCHAYCLMGNHYHLLLETPEPRPAGPLRRAARRWPGRSFRATAGEEPVPGFLTVAWVRSLAGATSEPTASSPYVRFVEAGGLGQNDGALDHFRSNPRPAGPR